MQKWDMKSFAISDYKGSSDEKDDSRHNLQGEGRRHIRWEGRSGNYNAASVWKTEGKGSMAGDFSHERQASAPRQPNDSNFLGCRAGSGLQFDASLTSQGPALISIQQGGGAAMAERSNWTTP